MMHSITALLLLSLSCARASDILSGNWVLVDTSGQQMIQHFSTDDPHVVIRLSLNGQAITKKLHKVKGAFSEGSKVSIVEGTGVTQAISGISIGIATYKDEADTAVITVAGGDVDGLVLHEDGQAWRLHAESGGQFKVDDDGNVEGLCAGDESTDVEHRRLAVQRWTNCYTGDAVTRRFSIGVVVASGLFERRFNNNHIRATEWLNSIVAEANLIYKQQLNIVLTVGELVIQKGSQNSPSWDDPSCQLGLSAQLRQFRSWEQPSQQGLWHLFDDCFGSSGSSIGLATMLVADPPGTLCMMERVRGHNEFWNTAVSWYSSGTWKTFAHEVGHNFGAHHSFEDGSRSTGGIMDYGDGKLNGEYQFNTKYRKDEVCGSIQKVIGTCAAFSELNGMAATTTIAVDVSTVALSTTTAEQSVVTTQVPPACGDWCQDSLVAGGRVTITFNGVAYNDCASLILATDQFASNFWCSQFEPSAQLCQLSCGACTSACATTHGSTIVASTTDVQTSKSSTTGVTTSTSALSSTFVTTEVQTSMLLTTTVATSTSMASTTESTTSTGIQSGDVIFLKSYAGSGAHVDVQDNAVRARWVSRGNWQAFVIEKANGGRIQSGDTVFVRTHTNRYIEVEDDIVQARWEDKGTWQSMTIEKKHGLGVVLPDDLVCFKAHTNKYIDVQDDLLQARWEECGDWQTLAIEKEAIGAVFSGTTVTLKAHTGHYIDVQGDAVQAQFIDRGQWQSLIIENVAGRAIFSGDQVFLKAHTGNMLDVQDVSVQARWHDYGTWQSFFVEKEAGGAIMPTDVIFLRAHTGKVLEVQGSAVGAHWDDHGSWQALVIEAVESRRLSEFRVAWPTVGVVGGMIAWRFSVTVAAVLLLIWALAIFFCRQTKAGFLLHSAHKVEPREEADTNDSDDFTD